MRWEEADFFAGVTAGALGSPAAWAGGKGVCVAGGNPLYLFLCFCNDKRRENKWNQASISARLDQTHPNVTGKKRGFKKKTDW